MSVINKMLNDLDQRDDNEQAQEEVAFLTPVARRSKKWLVGLVGSIVSGILAVIISYMYYTELLNFDSTLELISPASQQTNTVKSTEQPPKQGQKTAGQDSVTDQPELIVIPKQSNGDKQVERTSTLSVVTVPQKANNSVSSVSNKSSDVSAPPSEKIAQNTPLSTVTDAPKINEQNDKNDNAGMQKALVTTANEPKLRGLPKADKAKMQISRTTLTPEQRLNKIYGAAKKLSRDGMIKEAITQYKEALKVKPDHQESRTELAALYYGRSMVAESLGVLSQGLTIDPDNSGWSLLAAKIHYKRTNYSAALGYLQLPIHAMDQVEYVALKATTLQKLRDYPRAADVYRQLTTAFPRNGRWWLGLGTTLEAQQDEAAAVIAYRKSLGLSNISQSSRQFVMSRLSLLEN